MFDNLGTALIQLFGFLGVFGFFVYQLLSDKKENVSSFNKTNNKQINSSKKDKPAKKRLFGRQKSSSEEITTPKKGWFR